MSQPECLVPDLGGGRHRAGPDDPPNPSARVPEAKAGRM